MAQPGSLPLFLFPRLCWSCWCSKVGSSCRHQRPKPAVHGHRYRKDRIRARCKGPTDRKVAQHDVPSWTCIVHKRKQTRDPRGNASPDPTIEKYSPAPTNSLTFLLFHCVVFSNSHSPLVERVVSPTISAVLLWLRRSPCWWEKHISEQKTDAFSYRRSVLARCQNSLAFVALGTDDGGERAQPVTRRARRKSPQRLPANSKLYVPASLEKPYTQHGVPYLLFSICCHADEVEKNCRRIHLE